ncbi:WYL domain-containing protein [Chryseobacterium sp.]|uniref:helix-turn-helix transcriptional regulator n=1 Tax=Chryseobacterium sp. TaxID=1871047 RepID=UPI002FCC3336
MAKQEQMLRLQYIKEILQIRGKRGATYREIDEFIEKKFIEKDRDFNFSERTFNRDRDAMEKVLAIKIVYDFSRKVYFIKNEELTNAEESVFDNLLLVEAYREAKANSEIMIFEPRKSRGLDLLHGIIHAIMHQNVLSFTYTKFWTDETSHRVVEPYALKEFQHRWYLLANEFKGEKLFIKTYALDRISDMEIKSTKFKKQNYDVKEAFKNSFGIISADGEPKEIILSFDWEQGNYIKSLPLHHSQIVLKEENGRTFFQYFLSPTYDFKKEILSFGNRVVVVAPQDFREEILEEIGEILKNYNI